ncbi:hypothetical protein BO94DRAFT_135417 [Aspergillus sclerotioniger CBS 115572]|uniref:Uncharacterized protein n=1 Tax=Aspergillus sclerotioniger CBS 115572 TaxID=1450535 RepID=A0A317XDS4_9EURO|nr:hypothetical protein BO94DRAFT_135417 [Aspergillus sclerotioniger CBS 115572]PWY95757.1 hypothetical protein BO94DRAFT_135417 [Aspergillus sclerotioniger CBS 115572]
MSNLIYKVKDAIIGHHNNASARNHGPGFDRYSPGDYERRTDTYGSGAGGHNDDNYGSGNTCNYRAGSGSYEPETERLDISATGGHAQGMDSRARPGFGGVEGGSSYNSPGDDTGYYAYSSTNKLDSGKMGSYMMGPGNVRFAGTQRNLW